MIISISGIAGIKDAVIASGIKNLLEGMDLGIAVGVEGASRPVAEPASQSPAEIAAEPKVRRVKAVAPAKKARKTAVKRAEVTPATSGGADPRGTRRDAIRAALDCPTGRNYFQLEAALSPTWPDLNRSMISTIVCQLAKAGECEQVDGKWRLCK